MPLKYDPNKLSNSQKEVIALTLACMSKNGIISEFMQAAILAVISKESNFIPKSELGYRNTPNDRIIKIFGSRVSDLTDTELKDLTKEEADLLIDAKLTALKKDEVAFFDKIYGGRYGNAANEGHKYRGRGLNQLTFKNNYEEMKAYTTADIVSTPDLLNTPAVACDVVVGFFLRGLKSKGNKLSLYNIADINNPPTLTDAVRAAYHTNTGWGKTTTEVKADRTGGLKMTFDRVGSIYEYIKTLEL
jgi:putative chitinase